MCVIVGGVCLRDILVFGIGCYVFLEVNVMGIVFKYLLVILCVWGWGWGFIGNFF